MSKIIRATTVPQSLNTFCKGLLRELSERYEVIGLSSPGTSLDEVAEREGIRVIAVPMERHISFFKDFQALWRIWLVFRTEKPTMVHSMTPKAGLLCMLAAMLARVPVRIHTFTGLVFPTSTGLKRQVLMFTDWLTCACATHIIPEGEGVKQDLQKNRITKKPLRVLGYGNVRGVDLQFFSRRPNVMEIASTLRDDSLFTFLFVGRIVKDKGVNELCQAFERIHAEYPNTRLWLVGQYEDSLDPIGQEARKIIHENDSVEFVGPQKNDMLLAYYCGADCFIMPSYREGFPNTVLEAGAMGLPSIVTDINGSREIIIEGKNGMIVPPRNVDMLFNAMRIMVQSTVDRQRMAGNARRMVAERFEQGFVRRCLYDYYDELLKPYV